MLLLDSIVERKYLTFCVMDNHQTFYSYIPAPDFCESGYQIGEKGVLGMFFLLILLVSFLLM